jgi:hypothetical protein
VSEIETLCEKKLIFDFVSSEEAARLRFSWRQNGVNGCCRAGRPDWENFRPLADCLLWAVSLKLQK